MKNLPKNRNIYIQKGRFYIDHQKDGERIRRSTGLKKSALAFDFIRKNYDRFIGSKAELEQARRDYYELENTHVDRQLRKKEEDLKPIKNNSEFSFDSVIDKLLKEKSFLKSKTIRLYEVMSSAVSDFLEYKGIYYLSDFQRYHSVEFVQFCKDKGLKDSSISGYCSFLKMLFRYALSNDLISKNPFCMPRFKQQYDIDEDEKFTPFSLEEILELIKNADDEELRLFLIVAFFTGARTGEILALTFGDLDFENRQIRINKTLSDAGIVDSPKTKTSNRKIDMLDIIYKELIKLDISDKNARIFKRSRSMIRIKFNDLQEKLGYNIHRLYDTRHSFASVMLSRGEEPMWVGCKMMGHKDLNETYRSYAKYLPKEVKQRAVFLNDIVI
ncbi:site-specific integrase [Campylobacter hyointestinalis]|uniref:site-specific integrase n=1 Tax=Campylobacter hyointestinalis TaxID=198 RepID=UPI000CE3C5D9|nr:site-specific integrase [Campylobacter hyointestinalis]PPB57184.1 site-specific integrase [Campylobacter hyointestinalis subsp. hyointestinalis]PPB66471.1 site-specific integrase [Campylobacter hyointestinalis subsp. hyointestinalis]